MAKITKQIIGTMAILFPFIFTEKRMPVYVDGIFMGMAKVKE